MKDFCIKLADSIDAVNGTIGRAVAWLTLLMVIGMCATVIQRYVFDASHVWQYELIQFMHAIVFLTVAGYTLRDDKHVRVDVLYERFSPKRKAQVNLIGTLVFLFPVCVALLYFSAGFIANSWQIYEHSREYDGMPGIFIIKTFIGVFAFILIIQGVGVIMRSVFCKKL